DFDPLALETKVTPVEESTGVTATSFVRRLVMQGQELVEQHQPVVMQGQ
nr:hypothetical protein [Tanacetum cinerariifolium]